MNAALKIMKRINILIMFIVISYIYFATKGGSVSIVRIDDARYLYSSTNAYGLLIALALIVVYTSFFNDYDYESIGFDVGIIRRVISGAIDITLIIIVVTPIMSLFFSMLFNQTLFNLTVRYELDPSSIIDLNIILAYIGAYYGYTYYSLNKKTPTYGQFILGFKLSCTNKSIFISNLLSIIYWVLVVIFFPISLLLKLFDIKIQKKIEKVIGIRAERIQTRKGASTCNNQWNQWGQTRLIGRTERSKQVKEDSHLP